MKDRQRPLFMIGVVCEMFHIHPQTLRLYEREGFINPKRVGGARLYSQDDLERIRMVLNLTKELGVNRAGVDIILRMKHRMESLQNELEEMMDHLEKDIRKQFEKKIRTMLGEA